MDGEVIKTINRARVAGGRIVAVGTTTVRVLETASANTTSGPMKSFDGYTDLFIYPGYNFSVVDAVLTNFHLPKSTLLMMMGAFMEELVIVTLLDKTFVLAVVVLYTILPGWVFANILFVST